MKIILYSIPERTVSIIIPVIQKWELRFKVIVTQSMAELEIEIVSWLPVLFLLQSP